MGSRQAKWPARRRAGTVNVVLDLALLAPEAPRKITRERYDRMVSLGLLEHARVELLHGAIIQMSPTDNRTERFVRVATRGSAPRP